MCKEITIEQLMEYYIDTLTKCDMSLLNADDETIAYNIFEECDIGVQTFLHHDSLERLKSRGLINNEIMNLSEQLRTNFIALRESEHWNVNAIKKSKRWHNLFILSENIQSQLEKM